MADMDDPVDWGIGVPEPQPVWHVVSFQARMPAGREVRQPTLDEMTRLNIMMSDMFGFDMFDCMQVEVER